MIILSVILAVVAVLLLVVGAAGWAGKLPGNSVIGLRIPEVRKTPELWTIAHKIAGPAWVGSGVALGLAAWLLASASGWMFVIVALLVVGAVVLLGMGAGLAAHTVAQIDAASQRAEAANEGGSCCSSGDSADAAGGSCCSPGAAGVAAGDTAAAGAGCSPAGPNDGITAEDCASGNACGSCALNGACEGGSLPAAGTAPQAPAVDFEAAMRAVTARDA